MWPTSAQGKRAFRKNNFGFSPCSKRRVMEILRSSREFCFVEDPTPFCGNGIQILNDFYDLLSPWASPPLAGIYWDSSRNSGSD